MPWAFDFAADMAAGDAGEVPKKRRRSVFTKAMMGDVVGVVGWEEVDCLYTLLIYTRFAGGGRRLDRGRLTIG